MNSDYLFVYGTLRQGAKHPIFTLLKESAELMGKATVRGKLYKLHEYPGAKPSNKKNEILVGELYKLHPQKAVEVLNLLDEYEDYRQNNAKESLFVREITQVNLENNKTLDAWVYWYNYPVRGRKRIYEGDYLKFIAFA